MTVCGFDVTGITRTFTATCCGSPAHVPSGTRKCLKLHRFVTWLMNVSRQEFFFSCDGHGFTVLTKLKSTFFVTVSQPAGRFSSASTALPRPTFCFSSRSGRGRGAAGAGGAAGWLPAACRCTVALSPVARCWTTCASSCASSFRLGAVAMFGVPSALTMSSPTVYARAFMARAESAALLSPCRRTLPKSWPKAFSMNSRVALSRPVPGPLCCCVACARQRGQLHLPGPAQR